MAEPALPPLRDVIRRHGLGARKSLGQNFLLDLNLTRRIARAAAPLDDADVIEVGPGPGGLTRALLIEGARRVIAVERDERCIAALQELAAAFPGRLEIVSGDALAIDVAALARPPRAIVANLPYNIATPLLIAWLRRIGQYRRLTLMFQKEVALRLTAAAGTGDYGRLSVLTQFLCEVTPAFDVAPTAFVPPPKVTSRVVNFVPLAAPRGACRIEDLERVTAAAFGQRRKMLRQSLKALGDADALLTETGIDPTARAETLSVEAFAALATAMGRRAGG
ncbi:MAG TPA: 16S rRNA (adenine(1518)-N(6)/adenine(1519)-N(6))-dimethyltransferase RsmA [Stellaceae bacterium]|nr:16S rRNA (adenine(1518)-N(6)/adenine(1519)-N(6))-dimethyltransferase RsmA [Stellaceae bacterium]